MSDSRTKNTKRNIITGLVQQAVNIVFPFIVRTMIIYLLGEQYLGLSGLFTSILSVLNLSELGFSYAVIYILFKPIADNDNELICALMNYLKKVYKVVGLVLLVLGILFLPFIHLLINRDYPSDINIYVIFCIYLSNSAMSYWLSAYKTSLLTAMQRMDIVNTVNTVVRAVMQTVQIIAIALTCNYYCYIIFMPIFTIVNNIMIAYEAKRLFPDVVPKGILPKEVKSELVKQVKGVLIGKVGDVARNSADSIFVSMFIGLAAVAVYNNYFYVYNALYGVSLIIVNGMGASIGNSIVNESIEKNYNDLLKFTFIYSWFTGWCTICMLCLYQDFMLLWMRGDKALMLPDYDMILFCIYFYAITMNNIRNQYVNGCGLFYEMRISNVAEALLNIVLNLTLGYFFGITGIIAATIITIILFNYVARTNTLFKIYFNVRPAKFYLDNIIYAGVTATIGIIVYFICSIVSIDGFAGMALKFLICVIVPNALYILAYSKTERINYVKDLAKNLLLR